jgi:hypothetical protein
MSTHTQTAHTPGNWSCYNARGGRIWRHWYVQAGDQQVAKVTALPVAPGAAEQEYANAHLMAAAPELLAALNGLLNCPALNEDFEEPETREAIDKAIAAIDRATA